MKIYVDLDHVDITEYTQIESGEYNTNKINFIFTPEYKDLVKVAIFGCKLDTEEPKFYKVYLTDDSCYIPPEVLEISDVITIGCYGYKASGETLNLRYSPTPVKVIVYEGSFKEGAENSSPLTPTEVEQIMSRIATLDDEVDDLDGRVTVLEGKACDVDSIRERVTDLEVDVDTINNKIDIIESDIDELEGDIANTYSKTEVDTLLEAKVDTTTYNSGQAAQDSNINDLLGLVEGFPRTDYAEGSNISLANTLKWKLEYEDNKVVKGNTSQNTLTGKNLLNISTGTDTNETSSLINNELTLTSNNIWGYYSIIVNTTIGETYTISTKFKSNNGTIKLIIRDSQGDVGGPSSTTNASGTLSYTFTARQTTTDIRLYSNFSSSNVTNSVTYYENQFEKSSSATSFEQYCGCIPSPNPSYPQNINVVTGTQEVTVSDSNGNSTTHTLHLGNLELSGIGNYIDCFETDRSTGKWYKYGTIDKATLLSSMCTSVTASASYGTLCYLNFNGKVDNSNICAMSDKFVGVSYDNRTSIPTGYRIFTSDGSGVVTIRFPNNSDIDTLQEVKDFLDNNVTKCYYLLGTPTSTEITDTTLINELEELYNMCSYSGTTNISISGNLPFIMKVRALTLS